MRAWRIEQVTDNGEMQLRDIAVPQPAPEQLLLRVEAAGLAFGDALIVRGKYQVKPPLPFTPGSEVVGRIAAVGSAGTAAWAVGTRVRSLQPAGRLCRLHAGAAGRSRVHRRQPRCGAALALRSNYPTSLFALRHAGRLQAGETLLVHAGAGGVDSAAVQLGKRIGARVVATAGKWRQGPGLPRRRCRRRAGLPRGRLGRSGARAGARRLRRGLRLRVRT